MSLLAWLRRLAVSFGIGATSYVIMLGIMVVSVLFDQEAEPVITLASDAGRGIVSGFDSMVSGSHWGQVAVNHLRERVNMTHVVLSIPAVLIASLVVGMPLNKWLGGTRTALQRIAIALTSVPATVVLAVALFSFNATVPGHLRGAAEVRGLGVAGVLERAERLGRHHTGRAQADQCGATRILGPSLRDHGALQHGRVVPRQRDFRAGLQCAARRAAPARSCLRLDRTNVQKG